MEEKVTYKKLNITADELTKGPYPHFMLKEINEEPNVVRRLIQEYFEEDDIIINEKLLDTIRSCDKINFVACGTSMHASYMAKYFFEKFCGIPSEVFCASELVYSTPLIKDNPCFIYLFGALCHNEKIHSQTSFSVDGGEGITIMKETRLLLDSICKQSEFEFFVIIQ